MADFLSENWGWLFLGVIVFGGTIVGFFEGLRDILMTWAGRNKGLGKAERKELDRLRVENGQLKDVLRDVKSLDRLGVITLPTEQADDIDSHLTKQVGK